MNHSAIKEKKCQGFFGHDLMGGGSEGLKGSKISDLDAGREGGGSSLNAALRTNIEDGSIFWPTREEKNPRSRFSSRGFGREQAAAPLTAS